jgi:hypothetical protein
VSTDHGLEQDFNSLDAQHDAAQAYIRSQTHAAGPWFGPATMTAAIPVVQLTALPCSGSSDLTLCEMRATNSTISGKLASSAAPAK